MSSKKEIKRRIRKTYEKGRQAYADGVHRSSNPYEVSAYSLGLYWTRGWDDAAEGRDNGLAL